jgi:hypothetical protein
VTTTPAADPWVTPSVRADGHTPLPMPPDTTRSIGSASVRRVDHILIASGVLAIGAAVLGFSALSLPWVLGRVSSIGDRGNEHPVAEFAFRASDSFGGMVALAIAVVMTIVGLLWFWYGLDRGARLPSLAHPGIAIVAGLAGGAVMAVAKFGWVFWEGAFVSHAREAGLSRGAMQALLDDGAKRVVEIEQVSGFHRFGYAAAVALAAGLVAVWSQRQRAFR